MSPMLSLSEIKKRLALSFMSLTARQIALRALSFVSINIILARILPIETLGIFNIATSIVTFFAFFSDIGLAASLIQKKEAISEDDIKTTFTIQQFLVGLLSLAIIISAPHLATFYNLNSDSIWLIRTLGLAFFLSSLKVVPSVLLERELKFHPLVLVELVETILFNGLLIVLVIKGFGIWSFSLAALSRGFIGVILIYILAPVKVSLGVSKVAAKKLLSFGLPYQTNSLLALLKDRLVPLVIAKMVGPVAIGYITWSQSMAFLPLEIMGIIIRVTFPAFSRLQDDKKSLVQAVEKSLFVTALAVYPLLFGLGALLPAVVNHVVSAKWQPAVTSFYLFAFSTFWAVISTTLTNTLNAIGHIKTTLKLMVFWTILTWVLTPILVYQYGFIGVGMTSFVISFTSIVTIVLVKRVLAINIFKAIFLPLVASLSMSVIVYFFSQGLVRDRGTLSLAIFMGALIYALVIYLFGRKRLLEDLKTIRNV